MCPSEGLLPQAFSFITRTKVTNVIQTPPLVFQNQLFHTSFRIVSKVFRMRCDIQMSCLVRSLCAICPPCSNIPCPSKLSRGFAGAIWHIDSIPSFAYIQPTLFQPHNTSIWHKCNLKSLFFFRSSSFRCTPVVCFFAFSFGFCWNSKHHRSSWYHFCNNISLLARVFGQFSFILQEIYGWNWFQYIKCVCVFVVVFLFFLFILSFFLFFWRCLRLSSLLAIWLFVSVNLLRKKRLNIYRFVIWDEIEPSNEVNWVLFTTPILSELAFELDATWMWPSMNIFRMELIDVASKFAIEVLFVGLFRWSSLKLLERGCALIAYSKLCWD